MSKHRVVANRASSLASAPGGRSLHTHSPALVSTSFHFATSSWVLARSPLAVVSLILLMSPAASSTDAIIPLHHVLEHAIYHAFPPSVSQSPPHRHHQHPPAQPQGTTDTRALAVSNGVAAAATTIGALNGTHCVMAAGPRNVRGSTSLHGSCADGEMTTHVHTHTPALQNGAAQQQA